MPDPATSSPRTCHGSIALRSFQPHVFHFDFADEREPELEEGFEPCDVEVDVMAAEVGDDIVDVGADVPGQQIPVVEVGAPTHESAGVRLLPEAGDEGSHQQRLHQRHLRVRRHLERPEFEDAQPAPFAVRAEQLVDTELGTVRVAGEVDEQMPYQSVDRPRRDVGTLTFQLGERDLQFVDGVDAPFVDPRGLARRTDELAGEQVGHRRMVLPERHHAAQEIGAAQQRAVEREWRLRG